MIHATASRVSLVLALVATATLNGCIAGTITGGMMESYRKSSTHAIPSEYDGLGDKSFAVVVAADRIIETNHPEVVASLTARITQRLIEHAGASGVVPPGVVLQYQYNHPRWVAMTYEELAKHFGVDRLVYIDLYEFRLHEPGNAYLWSGLAAGLVGVVEADGPLGDDFAFSKHVSVKFPDEKGYGPKDYTKLQLTSVLQRRFIDRITWLFYEHQEPYYPKY